MHHVGKVLASLLLRLHTPGIRRCGLLEASKLIWLLLYLRLLGLQLHTPVPRLLLLLSSLHHLLLLRLHLLRLHLLRWTLWGSTWWASWSSWCP